MLNVDWQPIYLPDLQYVSSRYGMVDTRRHLIEHDAGIEPTMRNRVRLDTCQPHATYREVQPDELRMIGGEFQNIAHKTASASCLSIFKDGLGNPTYAGRLLHCSTEANHSEGWKCGKPECDDTYVLCPFVVALLVQHKKIVVFHAMQTRTILIKVLQPIDTIGQPEQLAAKRTCPLDEQWSSGDEQWGARQVKGLPPYAFTEVKRTVRIQCVERGDPRDMYHHLVVYQRPDVASPADLPARANATADNEDYRRLDERWWGSPILSPILKYQLEEIQTNNEDVRRLCWNDQDLESAKAYYERLAASPTSIIKSKLAPMPSTA